MIGIYKITSPNKRVYIGQTINYNKRLVSYKNINQNKSQIRLKQSFFKYGIDNHVFEFIEECEINKLNNRERYWQDYYSVLSKNGLNCKLTETSDKSGKLSEETKLKIGIGNKGVKRNSLERRLEISLFMKTREISDITKKRNSESQKGKIISEKHKEALRIARRKEINSNVGKKGIEHFASKKVICTETGIVWDTITDCGISINISVKNLSRYLNGTRKNKTTIKYL